MAEIRAVQAAGYAGLADEVPERALPAVGAVDLLQRLKNHQAHRGVIPLYDPHITW